MNLRKPIAAALAALSIGVAGGVLAGTADATIGPFGGRTLTAESPYGFGYQVRFGYHINGNGGQQTINTRLMRFTGSGWQQVGATRNDVVTAGTIYQDNGWYENCTPGTTYTYTVWTKWASYLWNDADISPGKNITC